VSAAPRGAAGEPGAEQQGAGAAGHFSVARCTKGARGPLGESHSLVVHELWVLVVAGSNPASPTRNKKRRSESRISRRGGEAIPR
jgi:hypothetical protein